MSTHNILFYRELERNILHYRQIQDKIIITNYSSTSLPVNHDQIYVIRSIFICSVKVKMRKDFVADDCIKHFHNTLPIENENHYTSHMLIYNMSPLKLRLNIKLVFLSYLRFVLANVLKPIRKF